jgi:Mor family transcriptional regulator
MKMNTSNHLKKFSKENELKICNLYEKEFLSVPKLSEMFSCGKTTIHRILKRNSVEKRGYGQHLRKFDDQTEETICNLYKMGKNSREIGKLYNTDYRTIWSILKRHNIECRSQNLNGKNNPNWKGGIAYEPYCILFNNEFKERVREFWGRKCVISGITEEKNGKKLAVHHVSYDKDSCCEIKQFNCAPNLFIPVTKNWNVKMNGNREYWEEMLTNYIMIWYNGKCYLPKEEIL